MTLDGKNLTNEDALPGKGQPSPSKESSPSTPTPKVFSEEQVDKLIADRHSTLDKRVIALEKDLDRAQATVEKKESELATITQDKAKLRIELDELAQDDPDKQKVLKKLATLDELEKATEAKNQTLKADREALEADKQTHQEEIKLASDTLREISIWEIASEYEGGDPVKLKELCDKFAVSSKEQIKVAADTIWAKKPKDGTPPITTDSSLPGGGGEKTEQQKLDDRYPTMKKK